MTFLKIKQLLIALGFGSETGAVFWILYVVGEGKIVVKRYP